MWDAFLIWLGFIDQEGLDWNAANTKGKDDENN